MDRFWRIALRIGRNIAGMVLLAGAGHAQVATTTIVDKVYRADGTPAGGSILLSWPAFTTAASQAVPAGKTEVAIASNGGVNINVAPNSSAQPQGTFYTAVYHLSDGTVSTEYWSVPQVTETTIAAVRSQVVPATVAVQSASVAYVNSAISSAIGIAISGYLPLSGGTLEGPLYLDEDPIQTTEAATKHYVDSNVGSLSGGISTKIDLQPTATQSIIQPPGTTLSVSSLQNVQYARPNQTGTGNNGISNVQSQINCLSGGCMTIADPGYSTTEEPQGHPFPACFGGEPGSGDGDFCGYSWPQNTRLWDQRAGTDLWSYNNPINRFGGLGVTHPLNYAGTPSSDAATADWRIFDFDTDYGNGQLVPQEILTHQFAGGHNGNYPSLGGWAKTNLIGSVFKTVNFSQGQHEVAVFDQYCLGLGDCMGNPLRITYASGMSVNSDEGIHRGDQIINEDTNVFQGKCAGPGCSTGSTSILVCAVTNGNPLCSGVTGGSGEGDKGEGRFAIDISQASGGNLGSVTGSGTTAQGTGQITGVVAHSGQIPAQYVAPGGTFAPSTGLATLNNAISTATGAGMPGTQTVAVTVTSGSFSAGTGSTICIADIGAQEQAAVSAVTGSTITATFRKPHQAGALIAQGGTCGYLIALNADTFTPSGTPYRMAVPQMGSYTSGDNSYSYYYYSAGGYVDYIAPTQMATSPYSSAWSYYTHSVSASYNPSTGQTTVTGCCQFSEGMTNGAQGGGALGNITSKQVTISGATSGTGANDTNYNGTYTVTVTGENSLVYTPASAPTSTSLTGLTMTFCNCTFTMYPGAEVLSVYNTTTKTVDGTLVLGANTVAWGSGDLVEEPHWYMPYVADFHDYIGMFTPQYPGTYGRGYQYTGIVSSQLKGFSLANSGALTQYLGYGGTHAPPQTAMYTQGLWAAGWTLLSAPQSSLISTGCKPASPAGGDGCTKWDAAYSVLALQNSNSGYSYMNFDPANINWSYVFDAVNPGIGLQIGKNVNGTTGTGYGSPGLALSGAGVSLYTPSLTLNGATALTGTTGGSGTDSKIAVAAAKGTSGDCANWDAQGGIGDAGAPCVTTIVAGTGVTASLSGSTVTISSSGAISSVSASGGGITVTPTTGAVTVALNTANSNTWSGNQVYNGQIYVDGSATFGSNATYWPTTAATSSSQYHNSYYQLMEASIWNAATSTACGINGQFQMTALSDTTVAFGLGGVTKTACSGMTLVSYADASGWPDGMKVTHILTANPPGDTTTVAAGAGAGTSPAVSLSSATDTKGVINITTGSSPSASSVIATVTFGNAYQAAPVCQVTPASATAIGTVYSPPAAAGSFTVNAGGTALAAGTTYTYSYTCLN